MGKIVLSCIAGVLIALPVAAARTAAAFDGEAPAGPMAPAPKPGEAIAGEYQRALADGRQGALLRFIARHPGHRLADDARRRLDAGTWSRADEDEDEDERDPEASILAAFAAARRENTAAAYDRFLQRYAGHPFALEAIRLRSRLELEPRR